MGPIGSVPLSPSATPPLPTEALKRRQGRSAFLLPYSPDLRSCRLLDAFIISSLPHCLDQDFMCSKAPSLHGHYPASPLLQTWPPRANVPDSVLRLVLAVDSARLRCDHDVTPDLYDGLDPTPAASVLAYTDSCTNADYGQRLVSGRWRPDRLATHRSWRHFRDRSQRPQEGQRVFLPVHGQSYIRNVGYLTGSHAPSPISRSCEDQGIQAWGRHERFRDARGYMHGIHQCQEISQNKALDEEDDTEPCMICNL